MELSKDEIIRMALEAKMVPDARNVWFECCYHDLERFFSLAFAAGAAYEREKQAEQEPVRTKDLTDDEIADALYGKGCWRLGVHPDHLREYRRVIQADREKNK